MDKVAGKQLSTNDFTTVLKSKLEDVSEDATKNQSDAYLLTRSNHVGVQPISSVEGFYLPHSLLKWIKLLVKDLVPMITRQVREIN